MSRQTLAETLKGGILLMGILMLVLALSGGLVRLGLGDAAKGPAYRVEVNIASDAAHMTATSSAQCNNLFSIPSGAIDVTPPECWDPSNLEKKTGVDAALYLNAGFQALECRRFAMQDTLTDVVAACAWVMDSDVAAFAVHSALRPYPDSLKLAGIDRGYIVPEGFNVVRGRACFQIRRENDSDTSRELALAFVAGLATQDFGPGVDNLLRNLPGEYMVAGSERIFPGRGNKTDYPPVMVHADYQIEGAVVSGGIAVAESEAAARAMADAAAVELAEHGAARKDVSGTPAGIFFFLDGQLPVAVGSAGRSFFRIDGRGGITVVVKLAAIFAGHASKTGD